MINRAAIAAARRQLATQPDFLRTTPLMRVSGRTLGVECGEVWLKLEHLQVGGSFKARGMLYRLLANPVPESGVIIASGGATLVLRWQLQPGRWACAARCLCPKSRPKPNAPACGPWAPRWW
jgi:hypothetical protein